MKLGSVRVGGANPTRIMGILNVSPESFYKKSIETTDGGIARAVGRMERHGADIIDVGAMSSAPYRRTLIPEREESRRLACAIRVIQRTSNIPISVDTCRAGVAQKALELGADIVNDVTGLTYDKKMPGVLRRYGPSVVLCAHGRAATGGVRETKRLLEKGIARARDAGVPPGRITVDPAIGFFRRSGAGRLHSRIGSDWARRDLGILRCLRDLGADHPVMVSVSRKSFLGAILGQRDPAGRISGSLACEMLSVINGADVIRTHDVQESGRIAALANRTNKSL